MTWLLVGAYVVGMIPAAFLLYPFAKRDLMQDPHQAAAFFSVFWPLLVGLVVLVVPFWLLGKLVEAVWER